MLIIEGADRLGKSTLAGLLLEEAEKQGIPAHYSHMSRPNSNFNFFTHYKHMIQKYAVQDRFHLGGLVWHDGVIWSQRLLMIEAWLRQVGAVVVVLHASDYIKYEKWIKADDRGNLLSESLMCSANIAYDSMVRGEYHLTKGDCPVKPQVDFHYDTTHPEHEAWPFPGEFVRKVVTEWSNRLRTADQALEK